MGGNWDNNINNINYLNLLLQQLQSFLLNPLGGKSNILANIKSTILGLPFEKLLKLALNKVFMLSKLKWETGLFDYITSFYADTYANTTGKESAEELQNSLNLALAMINSEDVEKLKTIDALYELARTDPSIREKLNEKLK